MSVVVVTPPAPLVTRDLAKKHLRVDGVAEDTLIDLYIAAASGHIDGPDAYLGRAIGEQTLDWSVDQFPVCGGLTLPVSPALAVTWVKYIDAAAVEQTLDPADYRVVDGVILPPVGGAFPTTPLDFGGVSIRFTAGYAAVPQAVQAAVLLMVSDLYKNREFEVEMSQTAQNLLRPYRLLEI